MQVLISKVDDESDAQIVEFPEMRFAELTSAIKSQFPGYKFEGSK